jgi:hypothetical protein
MADYDGGRGHARVLSPEAYCFILDLDGDDRLEFQLMPDIISENKSAMYHEVPIVGRSLPLLGYGSSTSRAMGLSLQFTATHPSGKYSPEWIVEQVRWLESKVYPEYEDGFVYPPHRLLVVVGVAIGMQAVMTSVNTAWMGPWAFTESTATPFRAQVDCQFQEYGMNEDEIGHPHDHAQAKSGENQRFEQSGSTQYVDIPLVV